MKYLYLVLPFKAELGPGFPLVCSNSSRSTADEYSSCSSESAMACNPRDLLRRAVSPREIGFGLQPKILGFLSFESYEEVFLGR